MTQKAFITGGAGFIGSNLAKKLLKQGYAVTIFDNFSTGFKENIEDIMPHISVIHGSILDQKLLIESMKGHTIVFHMAANADVKGGLTDTYVDLESNTIGTYHVLEGCRLNNIGAIAFASSATVYGDPQSFPTKETYPAIQTSLYGASKKAGESMIEAYSEGFGIKGLIFRFVSFIGINYSHGVLYDFYHKLMKNPETLLMLGDGSQKKSYLDVNDGINAMLTAINHLPEKSAIYNIGHDDYITVNEVASLVCQALKLPNVRYEYTGGNRGWIGDSPFVHLDTSELKSLGWKPTLTIQDGIANTLEYLQKNPYLSARKVSDQS